MKPTIFAMYVQLAAALFSSILDIFNIRLMKRSGPVLLLHIN